MDAERAGKARGSIKLRYIQPKNLQFSHHLLTLTLFSTCVTLFCLWKTKGAVLENILVAVFNIIIANEEHEKVKHLEAIHTFTLPFKVEHLSTVFLEYPVMKDTSATCPSNTFI